MRRILIDRARRKHTQRHGGGYQRVDFEGFDLAAPAADGQLLAVNEALDKLALKQSCSSRIGQGAVFCRTDQRGSFSGSGNFTFHRQELLDVFQGLAAERN
jgi:hypothetical protein